MTKPATPPAEASAAEAPAAPRPWMGKVKIIGIIAAIMILELVAMMFVMPRGQQAASSDEASAQHSEEHGDEHPAAAEGHGGKEAKGGHGKKEEHGSAASTKSGSASEEIDLGEFSVTSYQPAASTTLFISFHLYGTLQHKNSDELQRRLDDNKHRVRDNIIVIIRSAEITDLTDAGLGLIKRRILETTNKTLGKPLLQAVVFSEFSFVEQ